MIDLSSSLIQTGVVFGTLALILVYIAYRLAKRDPPRNAPIQTADSTEHSYQTPDDWDEQAPLRFCNECRAFNHVQYRFCRGCTGELRTARMIPPRSVTQLQKQIKNRP